MTNVNVDVKSGSLERAIPRQTRHLSPSAKEGWVIGQTMILDINRISRYLLSYRVFFTISNMAVEATHFHI